MAAKGSSRNYRTGGNTRSRQKGRSGKNKKGSQNSGIRDEVALIFVLAAAVLLFLCNFGLIGPAGDVISHALFGLFGLMAYIVPVVIFLAVAFRIANRGAQVATIKLAAGGMLFFLTGIILELVWGTASELSAYSAQALYQFGMEHKMGGGVICGSLAYALYHFLDMAGTVLVVLVLGIVCVVVITEKSLLNGVRESGRKVYESAVEDADKRRERAQARKEEEAIRLKEEALKKEVEEQEKILRMDKKVSGVMMDISLEKETEDGAGAQRKREDMHEIILSEEEVAAVEKIRIHTSGQTNIQEIENQDTENEKNNFFAQEEEDVYANMEIGLPEDMEMGSLQAKPVKNPNPVVETKVKSEEIRRKEAKPYKYIFPPLKLLAKAEGRGAQSTAKQLKDTAIRLQQTLQTFGVKVTVTDISQGPSVTRYELQPEVGVKVSRIVGLSDDIKLNLAATDIRIEAPIPGKAAVGIEVPNKENSTVTLRELLESREFKEFSSNLAFAVGKDIGGNVVVADIAKMPHMLIAGATGSGKSVCINTLIMSLIYKSSPEDVKLIMVDPKVVELSVYNSIPHLLIPVVTDPKKAAAALQWGVSEMTDRYKKFADFNVRDMKGYNKKVEGMKGQADAPVKMPHIVIIVDELADLMMVAPGEVEESICRLAQLARAAGIHLIIATQRPSVDVITGLIKANMPSRVAFAVSSGVDSRTILDMNGAEKLLGKGDMLFYPQGYPKPVRVQGAFVSDREVADVVDFLKNQALGNVYSDDVEEKINTMGVSGGNGGAASRSEKDDYFVDAGKFVIEKDKASIGMLQRVFKIGFNRAARIMDQLCDAGVVGEEEGTKPRKVLMSIEEFEQYMEECV